MGPYALALRELRDPGCYFPFVIPSSAMICLISRYSASSLRRVSAAPLYLATQ